MTEREFELSHRNESIIRKTADTPKRLACFGTATTQDTCMQCPDNEECVNETMKRYNEQETTSGKESNERTEKLMPMCRLPDCIHWNFCDCEYGLAYRLRSCEKYAAVYELFKKQKVRVGV